jgi:hypothetical protein
MTIDNWLIRLIAQLGKHEEKKLILSQYGPPSRDDVAHDGLVGSGEMLGGILGTLAGTLGGEAVGGPRGGVAGGAVLGPVGALAGGWGAHGAYLEGQLINDILSHPEDWTVDAAGAIVPVTQGPAVSSAASADAGAQRPRALPVPGSDKRSANPIALPGVGAIGARDASPVRYVSSPLLSPPMRPASTPQTGPSGMSGDWPSPSVLDAGVPPMLPFPPRQGAPGGLLGMMAEARLYDPSNPDQPPSGGLLGLYLEAMRNSAVQGGDR